MPEQSLWNPLPATKPVQSATAPVADEPKVFADSAELGEQINRLEHEQAEVDRRAAEELTRLRELQDRD